MTLARGKTPYTEVRGFVLRGERHECMNGRASLLHLANTLQEHYPAILSALEKRSAQQRNCVPYAVRDGDKFLKHRGRHEYCPLPGQPGWLILVPGSTAAKCREMELMVSLAGLDPDDECDFKPIVRDLAQN